ncbi:MAG: methylenetetrahydrofolate reductase [NAD(P)H] [Pseudomonadales bacterium]
MRLSYEFFPPRTEQGQASLLKVANKLDQFAPDFYSVTYGAGGSTRDGTRDTVNLLQRGGRSAAPHLSIGEDQPDTIRHMLSDFQTDGVQRIVALRGDVPSGAGGRKRTHNAEELVRWIRDHSEKHFHVEVAAYPEVHPDASSPADDLAFFTRKVEAGADSAITQYFYNTHSYNDFLNRCAKAGITIPIYPGIMPITNFDGIVRFSKNCGADIPRWVLKHLEAYQNDEASLKSFAVDMVTSLCEDLLQAGAPGLHFYTLNRWGATNAICENLNLAERSEQKAS